MFIVVKLIMALIMLLICFMKLNSKMLNDHCYDTFDYVLIVEYNC